VLPQPAAFRSRQAATSLLTRVMWAASSSMQQELAMAVSSAHQKASFAQACSSCKSLRPKQ
jgi:hypothetical protein